MHRLRQQQPKLHRELCNIAFRLQRVRDALVDLPEAYVLDGAMSEILMLTDHAVKEARDSLSVPGRRRPHCLTSSQAADDALVRAIQTQETAPGSSTTLIVFDDSVG